MSNAPGPVPSNSVDELRRLKDVETEWEAKLAAAKTAAQERLVKAREAAEAAVHAARAEVERVREFTLASARAAAQKEAEKAMAQGRQQADAIASDSPKSLGRVQEKLLKAVLRGFRGTETAGK